MAEIQLIPPLATTDQIAVEHCALRLLGYPVVRAAISQVADYWKGALNPNAEHLARFEHEYEQAVFCALMNAANNDPERPRIHSFGRYEHLLDGKRVPATRSGHPNPDYIYRFMPVDGTGRYVIRGRLGESPPTAVELSLLTGTQVYLKNISLHELVTEADGTFTLTIDSDPAEGRPNHFRTNADAKQMLFRDILADFARQRPLSLEVERLGPEPVRPEATEEELAASCETHLRKHVDDLLWVNANLFKLSANEFRTPEIHTEGVYSVSQAYSAGHFALAEDMALIFTLTLGNAAYAVVPVSDRWGGIGPVLDHLVAMNTIGAEVGRDGRFSFVLSHKDPGVYNWIDPAGLHEGVAIIRWVGFDPVRATSGAPALEANLIRLEDVAANLSSRSPRITAAMRAQQLALRKAGYLAVLG